MADDRTPDEVARTIGFWVATDRFLSGWGHAPGRSIVACPVTGWEDCDRVERVFHDRSEFLRVRYIVGQHYQPRLRSGDHLHIYNTRSSFRPSSLEG